MLIFIKWLLAFPHYIALGFLAIGAFIAILVSFFAVLITGRWPRGAFNYMVGTARWGTRVGAYVLLLTDKYPPFSLADDPSYPVRVQIDYPEHIARWRPLVNWLHVLPAAIVAELMLLLSYIWVSLAWIAILFTGQFPQGLFNAMVVAIRWTLRTSAFQYWMTEPYPWLGWE